MICQVQFTEDWLHVLKLDCECSAFCGKGGFLHRLRHCENKCQQILIPVPTDVDFMWPKLITDLCGNMHE
jgi:hypothetical protein